MALTIKALNNDTSFLLIFTPPIAPQEHANPEQFPGAYTILVDPWISGPAQIIGPKFSHQEHVAPACISSLEDLPEPDMILISQAQPDHCHEETMCQLSPHIQSLILGPPNAIRKVRSWQHFDCGNLEALRKYNEKKEETVHRIEIPPFSPSGSPGEVTVSLLQPKRDFTGVHNAIGITYRPPYSVLSLNTNYYVNLPATPTSPPSSNGAMSPRILSSRANTIFPSPYNNMEKTISILYSPHGVPYNTIQPWASTHLVNEAALPLLALIHSFAQVDMPWYMGGNMSTGCQGGLEIARNLLPKVWIGAHDEMKKVAGIATKNIWRKTFDLEDIKKTLWGEMETQNPRLGTRTEVMTLECGMDLRIDTKAEKLVPKASLARPSTAKASSPRVP